MPKYVVLEKRVGQTPLQVVDAFKDQNPDLADLPMAYAGRLDPMASGKLLVLIGEECKKQKEYHNLDKEYEFEVLFGTSSDTADVLGLVKTSNETKVTKTELKKVLKSLLGPLALRYPQFSSKTVKGKPLHMWTLEGRLEEIEHPVAYTMIYNLQLLDLRSEKAEAIYKKALENINSLPTVTEKSKELGRDFRRTDVRAAWEEWLKENKGKQVQIAILRSVASSGTYMRSLAEEIGRRMHTSALAYSIHRTKIGRYVPLPFGLGFWLKKYRWPSEAFLVVFCAQIHYVSG